MATLRKANGYTQADVAEKLNISNRTLSSWETDRTLPDVLMLPAIADLYGVTVDELLRGERNNNAEKATDITENSLKNIYKNKFGAFCSKRALLLGIALICDAVFIVACALSLWTNAVPAWLVWMMLVLSAVGLCACIVVLAYYYNNIKLSVGVVLDEDLTDDKKAFITALRHKLEGFMFICALAFAVFAAIVLITFVAVNPQYTKVFGFTFYVRNGYIFVICLNFALAVILFVADIILKATSVKRYYGDTQKAVAKTNRKLISKLALFGAIPLAAVIVVNVALVIAFPNGQKTLYQCDNFDAFRTHVQTLVIDKSEYPSGEVPEGEYYLAIPSDRPNVNYMEIDFGNGFYGTYHAIYNYSTQERTDEYWSVTYGKDGERNPAPNYWQLYVYDLDDGRFVVNARYYFDDHTYDRFGNKIAGDISAVKKDNNYCLVQDVTDVLRNVAVWTFTIVPILTVLTCAVIYAVKHKKQKYGF